MDELDTGYLLAVSAAAVWTPRPLVAMLSALGSARALVAYAMDAARRPPPPGELLGAEALARVAAVDDAAALTALQAACRDGVAFVTSADARYPARLRELCDGPPVLYYRGRLDALASKTVALVGSRAATPYGRSMAASMACDFGAFGATVVSGLARGVDAAAHRGALRGDTPTAAVIGSGLCALYPAYHRDLVREIVAAGGAIVSEFPPAMEAHAHHFPMRNRIVAALADATVVIEAGTKSGALITAGLAGELGRHVFAIPGDVGRTTSEGTNGLIKDGVTLATSAADVAAVLGWQLQMAGGAPSDPPDSAVWRALAAGAGAIDEICAASGLDCATVAAQLTVLEVQGAVERRAGGIYAAVRTTDATNRAVR